MTMNAANLGSEMATLIKALPDAVPGPGIDAICVAIATAVVAHITANAEITTISGAPDGEHTGIVT